MSLKLNCRRKYLLSWAVDLCEAAFPRSQCSGEEQCGHRPWEKKNLDGQKGRYQAQSSGTGRLVVLWEVRRCRVSKVKVEDASPLLPSGFLWENPFRRPSLQVRAVAAEYRGSWPLGSRCTPAVG